MYTLCSEELFCIWQTAHFQYWGRGLLASSRIIRSSTLKVIPCYEHFYKKA